MNKFIAILMGFSLLVLIGITATAESVTDPTGDVWHWEYTGSTWGWNFNYEGKPNIDIKELTYTIEGEQVTLIMEVAGTITNSELVSYWAYLNTSDSNYWLSWNNGQGSGMAISTEEGSFEMDVEPEIIASGSTISATFDVIGTFSSGIEFWGWAAEYTTFGDITNEWWADWAPNDESPYYNAYTNDAGDDDDGTGEGDDDDSSSSQNGDANVNNSNTSKKSTPGFELFALFVAVSIAFIFFRKKK